MADDKTSAQAVLDFYAAQQPPPTLDEQMAMVPDVPPVAVVNPNPPPPVPVGLNPAIPAGAPAMGDIMGAVGQDLANPPGLPATPVPMPADQPAPQAPIQVELPPSADQMRQQVAQAVQASAMPTPEDVQAAADMHIKPVVQSAIESEAIKQAQKVQTGITAKQIQDEQNAREELAQLERENDEKVRVQSLSQILRGDDMPRKLSAAFGVILGGFGQALTGGKSNVAIDIINNEVARQAEADKLNATQRESLRKQLFGYAENRARAHAEATGNALKAEQLRMLAQEMEMRKQQAAVAQQASIAAAKAMQEATNIIRGDEKTLPTASPEIEQKNARLNEALSFIERTDPKRGENLRQRVVSLPDGELVVSNKDPERVKNFENNVRPPLEVALNGLRGLRNLARGANKLSPEERVAVTSQLNILAGQLRIPITGPGVMTEEEFKRILATIGNPLSFTSWRGLESAKLNSTMNALEKQLSTQASQLGIKWPKSQDELLVKQLIKRGHSEEDAWAAVARRGQ